MSRTSPCRKSALSRWRSAWIRPNASGPRRAPPSRARPSEAACSNLRPQLGGHEAPAVQRVHASVLQRVAEERLASPSGSGRSPSGGRQPSAWSCSLAMAPPSRCRCTGRGAAGVDPPVHPAEARSRCAARSRPRHETVAVSSPSRVGTGSGTSRSVSARRAVSQRSSDRTAATGRRRARAAPADARGAGSARAGRPSTASTLKVVFSPWAMERSRGSARGYAVDRHGGQPSQACDLLKVGEHSKVVRA